MDLHSLLSRVKNSIKYLYNLAKEVTSTKIGRILIVSSTIAISVLILGYLLYTQKDVLLNYHWKLSYKYLIPFAILYALNFLLTTYVWKDILREFSIYASYKQHMESYAISNLAKRIPGTIWYIPIRSQLYNKDEGSNSRTLALASGIELFLLAISSFIIIVTFSLQEVLNNRFEFIGLLIGATILMSILLIPAVNRKIFHLFNQANVRIPRLVFLKWILIYVMTRIIGGSMLFCVLLLIEKVSFVHLTSVIGFHSLVAFLSLFIFILPTNFGFTEVGISLLLATIIPASIAVIVALANRILVITLDVLVGVIFGMSNVRDFKRLTKKNY